MKKPDSLATARNLLYRKNLSLTSCSSAEPLRIYSECFDSSFAKFKNKNYILSKNLPFTTTTIYFRKTLTKTKKACRKSSTSGFGCRIKISGQQFSRFIRPFGNAARFGKSTERVGLSRRFVLSFASVY